MSTTAALSADELNERPAPTILRRERALIELAAELIGDRLAAELPALLPQAVPTFEAAAPDAPETFEPHQALIYGPSGTGTSDAVYTVAGGVGALWPLSVMCRLTASATVADRTVALEYRTGDGTRYLVAGTQAAVQALGSQSFCWHPQAGEVAWPIEDAALAPLPQQHLYPGYQLALKVWNGQAGDVLDQVRISARFDPIRDQGE